MFMKFSESILDVLRPLKTKVPAKHAHTERQWQEWAPLLPETEPLNLVFKTKGELNPETKYWVLVEPRIGDRCGQVGSSKLSIPPGQSYSPWGEHWEVRVYPASKSQEEIFGEYRLELAMDPITPGPVTHVWPLNCGGMLYTVPEGTQQKELRLVVQTDSVDQLLAKCEQTTEEVEDRDCAELCTRIVSVAIFHSLGVKMYDGRSEWGKAKKQCVVVKFSNESSSVQKLFLYDDYGENKMKNFTLSASLHFGKVRELELIENSAYYFRNQNGHYLALTDETHCVEFVSGRDKVTIGAELALEPVRRRQKEVTQSHKRTPKEIVRLLMEEGTFAGWAPDKL